jgi:hypothetical protein
MVRTRIFPPMVTAVPPSRLLVEAMSQAGPGVVEPNPIPREEKSILALAVQSFWDQHAGWTAKVEGDEMGTKGKNIKKPKKVQDKVQDKKSQAMPELKSKK